MSQRARLLPDWLLVLLFFTLVGLALTWPLALRWTTDLPGGPHKDGLEDAYQNVWNLWWTWQALSRPANLLVTDRIFHPEQPNLFYHTLSPANTLMVAPVTALWGPVAAFNTVALLSFALGGLGMWLLARERAGSGPALLAGLVYVASPFHTAALITDGQLQIFAHQWLPWYIFFLLRALRDARPRDIALAALFLTLTAWTDWYYTLFLLMFTAGAGAWRIWGAWRTTKETHGVPERRAWRMPGGTHGAPERRAWPMPGGTQHAASLLWIGGLFALGAVPLLVPMLVEAARFDYMTIYPDNDPFRLSADLLAYLTPHRHHSLWGGVPWDWGMSYSVNRRFYVGLIVALLALLALALRPAARLWGLVALVFGILSLGPSLRLNGVDVGLPLPHALLADLPIFRLTRQPDRYNIIVTIALALLAAHGAAVLIARFTSRAWRWAALALLAGLIVLDYLPAPIVTRVPAVPPFLAGLPRDGGALIEYPFHTEITYRDAERMLFQTVHGRPISGGYHSRHYPQPQLGLPALRDLRSGQIGGDIAAEPGGWPAAMATLGYEYIIGYKQQPLGPSSLQPEDEAAFRALVEAGLGVDAPLYEDEWLIAYKAPLVSPAPVIQIRAGWGPVEEPAPGARYRWLGEEAELGLFAPAAGTYLLSFEAFPADTPRRLSLGLPGAQSTLQIAPGPRRYSLLLQLPAGRTVLTLRALEPPTTGDALEGNGDTRPISVRFAALRLEAAGK